MEINPFELGRRREQPRGVISRSGGGVLVSFESKNGDKYTLGTCEKYDTFEVFPSLMLFPSFPILKHLACFVWHFVEQLCVQGLMAWQWEGYVKKKTTHVLLCREMLELCDQLSSTNLKSHLHTFFFFLVRVSVGSVAAC